MAAMKRMFGEMEILLEAAKNIDVQSLSFNALNMARDIASMVDEEIAIADYRDGMYILHWGMDFTSLFNRVSTSVENGEIDGLWLLPKLRSFLTGVNPN